ncbi:MAG: TonB-dependent receptor, partial [Gammaproteobacteria bacterium]|nr:TonB-dependent receptor [Gammaproteobacteria bacterium]
LLRAGLVGALVLSPVAVPAALAQEGAMAIEEVVVVGSRRAGRTVTESAVPVDVLSSEDMKHMGTTDMDDMLRNLLPSYNVQRLPISDAATITRPATLRGLPPDNTLVLINGKRRHRASVIAELGGSLAAGSQGPDISVIPPLAIDRVEVLRDGASAQYGSDAIAGVINFVLKENREGITADARWGETYEGDGELWQGAVNVGMPLGSDGFASATLQVKSVDATSRSLPRTDAQALIDTGNTAVEQPAQIWGAPEVDDDVSFFLNAGIDLTDSQELYAFGNYAERATTGAFFYRNPNARPGVFTDSFSGGQRAIVDLELADMDKAVTNCPFLESPGSTPTDQAAVDADRAALNSMPDNCWAGNFLYPGGYMPAFGGDVEDISGLVGLRGTLDNGLSYDFSLGLGRNETSFRIGNTWNPSLGPESPTEFELGKYVQVEQNYNANFVYPVAVDAFHSDLNVAFGAEYRVETFKIVLGEPDSWRSGPFAFQSDTLHPNGEPMLDLSIGAHGFAGFSPDQAGEFDRANYAVYTDLEADVTEQLLVGVAVRFEDFTDFGTTTNGKLAARYSITPTLNVRGSLSSGFRAPTPGQSNVTKVSTITIDGELQQRGQIPPDNPIAQFLGGETLDAETATNLTLGGAWDVTDNLTLTLDYFEINVEDRISQTGSIVIAETPIPGSIAGDCPDAANLPQCLEALGIPGASDLNSVSFFTNDFETTTTGIDFVATYTQDWGEAGMTDLTAAWNWTETEVDDAGSEVSRNRVVDLENFNPEHRGIFTANHLLGDWRFLLRASYYDDWIVGDFSGDPFADGGTAYNVDCSEDQCYGGEWIFDAEVAYTLNDRYTFTVGGQNVFDEKGPRDANNTAPPGFSNNSGQAYATSTPWGFDGGFYYFRMEAILDY